MSIQSTGGKDKEREKGKEQTQRNKTKSEQRNKADKKLSFIRF